MPTMTTRRSTPPEGFEREVGPGGLETRALPGKERLEARAKADGKRMLSGYGSVFNQRATIAGWFYEWDEEVAPGAWAKSISEGDIRSMFNHDTNWLLGRTKSGSLRLEEDDTGLLYETDINADDPNALSVYARVERGDVDGSSIWFRIIRQEWTEPTDDNGLERPLRRILEGELFEAGPVVFPAFPQTTVSARSSEVLDRVLRAAGVDKASRRARQAAEWLSDPASAEQEIRSLFASAPELRDALCSCSTSNTPESHRAADEAPGAGNGTPPVGHLPHPSFYAARAKATAARFGLPT